MLISDEWAVYQGFDWWMGIRLDTSFVYWAEYDIVLQWSDVVGTWEYCRDLNGPPHSSGFCSITDRFAHLPTHTW